MKKKFMFWSINFFLTVITSFLLNGGIFAGNTEVISLSKGKMGAIKLSGNNSTIHVENKSSNASHPFRKHPGQGNRIYAQQKGKR